jgi:DNA invertase Pin-like site-specific DNA recombinase
VGNLAYVNAQRTPRGRNRARDYLRVSADRRGKLESPEEQGLVNRQHAEREGWDYGESYAEATAASASEYARKSREVFGRLVDDIERGRFGAEILMLWEASRGSRQMAEWVRLIDGCKRGGIRVYVTTHGRLYDPRNGRDYRSLMEDGVDSVYESSKTSERIRRHVAVHAATGRPYGKAPFGYKAVYDERTRELLNWAPEPAEAAIVADLFTRLHRGETLTGVARAFAAKGITTRGSKRFAPKPFSVGHLRAMALTAAYASLRVHQPGSGHGTRDRSTLAGAVDGTWPPLVDRAVFLDVHAKFTGNTKGTGERGKPQHLMSMIAQAECGSLLTARWWGKDRERRYVCRNDGCAWILADELDTYAVAYICAWLDRPENAALLAPDKGPEVRRAREQLAQAVADLADWRARAARREITAADFAAVSPGLNAAVTDLEDALRRLETPPALSGMKRDASAYADAWPLAGIPAQRAAARLVCSPRYLGTLVLGNVPTGVFVPVTGRVRWEREPQE